MNTEKSGLLRSFGLYPENWTILKESEWRFNNPSPKAQLQELKQWVRNYMG